MTRRAVGASEVTTLVEQRRLQRVPIDDGAVEALVTASDEHVLTATMAAATCDRCPANRHPDRRATSSSRDPQRGPAGRAEVGRDVDEPLCSSQRREATNDGFPRCLRSSPLKRAPFGSDLVDLGRSDPRQSSQPRRLAGAPSDVYENRMGEANNRAVAVRPCSMHSRERVTVDRDRNAIFPAED